MRCPEVSHKAGLKTLLSISMLIYSAALAGAQEHDDKSPLPSARARFVRAFVVDDRLSALRREANMQSQVIQRLRLGRSVFIIATKGGQADQPKFHRVAVTRRTRGWIHEAAIAVPGRAGEDERVIKLIDNTADAMDRISLCRLFIEVFRRSPLVPRVLLRVAEEAEQAAVSLTRRAQRRLKDLSGQNSGVSLRDYYLNDAGLDRYSRLRIKFDFNQTTAEYVYDGEAYRDIIKRFPKSEQARVARKQLDLARQRLAQHDK